MQDVEHCLLHDIQLVLHCVGHMGAGIVMQQYSALSEFSLMLVLDLHTKLLEHWSVTLFVGCVSM
jgi:hypothetical protein